MKVTRGETVEICHLKPGDTFVALPVGGALTMVWLMTNSDYQGVALTTGEIARFAPMRHVEQVFLKAVPDGD